MVKIFTQYMSDLALTSLHDCIGIPIKGIYCPGATIAIGTKMAQFKSASIPLGHRRYLVISNDWADTPIEAIDYYFLDAVITDRPKGINVSDSKSGRLLGWEHHHPLCHFLFGQESRIFRIEVFYSVNPAEEEQAEFDSAIRFSLESGFEFCFSPSESISGEIEINFDTSLIKDLLEPMHLRRQFYVPSLCHEATE